MYRYLTGTWQPNLALVPVHDCRCDKVQSLECLKGVNPREKTDLRGLQDKTLASDRFHRKLHVDEMSTSSATDPGFDVGGVVSWSLGSPEGGVLPAAGAASQAPIFLPVAHSQTHAGHCGARLGLAGSLCEASIGRAAAMSRTRSAMKRTGLRRWEGGTVPSPMLNPCRLVCTYMFASSRRARNRVNWSAQEGSDASLTPCECRCNRYRV